MNNNNEKHLVPFNISPKLFKNKRIKRWRCKLAERKIALSQNSVTISGPKHKCKYSNFGKTKQIQKPSSNRRKLTLVKPDVTIDLLSDDDADHHHRLNSKMFKLPLTQARSEKFAQPSQLGENVYVHSGSTLQLSMMPNITLIPVHMQPLFQNPSVLSQEETMSMHSRNFNACAGVDPSLAAIALQQRYHLLSTVNTCMSKAKRSATNDVQRKQRKIAQQKKLLAQSMAFKDSINLADNDSGDDYIQKELHTNHILQLQKIKKTCSPPPLAPLSHGLSTLSTDTKSVEEISVSLVPCTITTTNGTCVKQCTKKNHSNNKYISITIDNKSTEVVPANGKNNNSKKNSTLPDETTVHTVIANRIYELSLSKLREGLASSGVPEFSNDVRFNRLSASQYQCNTQPFVVTTPAAPISLKLSSDLSISLISDDEDDNIENDIRRQAVITSTAEDAAKLLQHKHPQLSVVQHVHYT